MPVVWTNARRRGFAVSDVHRWMSLNTARLAGLESVKGNIKEGFDADFVIWEPEESIKVKQHMDFPNSF